MRTAGYYCILEWEKNGELFSSEKFASTREEEKLDLFEELAKDPDVSVIRESTVKIFKKIIKNS